MNSKPSGKRPAPLPYAGVACGLALVIYFSCLHFIPADVLPMDGAPMKLGVIAMVAELSVAVGWFVLLRRREV